MESRLVKKVEERRKQEGLSKEAFSKALGQSHSLWGHITATPPRRNPGDDTIKAIARRYPELWNDILLFLTEKPTIVGIRNTKVFHDNESTDEAA